MSCASLSSCIDRRFVGDPVDTLTGAVIDRKLEFRLTGPLELRWYRHYSSAQNERALAYGWGHTHDFDRVLHHGGDSLLYVAPLGLAYELPLVTFDGGEARHNTFVVRRVSASRYQLFRHGEPAMEFVFATLDQPARIAKLFQGPHQITFYYDNDRKLKKIVDSVGRVLLITEQPAGRLRELSLERDAERPQRLMAYRYDQQGNLISTTNSEGHGHQFTYDAANRLIKVVGRKGFAFRFKYDQEGRCVSAAGDDELYGVTLRYVRAGRQTDVTKADGSKWSYQFDSLGRLAQVRNSLGGVERFVRDPGGRLTTEIDSNGNATQILYDAANAPVARIDVWGRWSLLPEEPNPPDPRRKRVAANAAEYRYGRLLSVGAIALPANAQSLSKLGSDVQFGLFVAEVHASKEPRRKFYVRSLGTPWWPEPASGQVFTPFGKLVRQYDLFGRVRSWDYDPAGTVARHIDFDGSVWHFDHGRWHLLREERDPNGAVTRYEHTTNGRVASCTDAGGTRSEYQYDAKDNLLEIRRNGRTREWYSRDQAGNLIAKQAADGRTIISVEVGPGNLPIGKLTRAGDEHHYRYDRFGRCIRASTHRDIVECRYNAVGDRVLDKRNGLGVEHRHPAWRGQAQTILFDRFVIVHQWIASRTLRVVDPGGKTHILRFHEHGIVERLDANGTREVEQFDNLGRCLLSTITRGYRRRTRRFHWSGEGELRRVEDSEGQDVLHKYDAAHRLVGRVVAGREEEYQYDIAGNLVRQPDLDGVSQVQGNRIGSANGWRIEYNDRDHVQERTSGHARIRYAYDDFDHLVRVETAEGIWEAAYDALERRVRKTWQGVTTEFYWNADQLIAEHRSDGLLRIYVYADQLALTPLWFVDYDSVDAALNECRRYYVHSDQVASPLWVEDDLQQEVWRCHLRPYGTAHIEREDVSLNLRWPGHYFDPELQLHYNKFRYYDPTLGRYLQSDPWGISGGVNLYAYPANPLLKVDVRGLGDDEQKTAGKKDGEEGAEQDKSTKQPLSPEDLQAAADLIHGTLKDKKGGDFKESVTTVTQSRDADGNIVHTVTSNKGSLRPCQREAAVALLGPDVQMPKGDRGPFPNDAHHAEPRGIAATEGHTDVQQASSSGAKHGGAACGPCDQKQRDAGVTNVTGVQEKAGGTGRNTPPSW
jgi:RHS repeat-associated protein